MFIGEYVHNLDAKGRLIIPSKFREELHSPFYLTRGLDGCLTIYSEEQWNMILKELSNLPNTRKLTRQYIHMLTSKASECTPDSQGRIQIPSYLADPVHIKKECAIVGVNDHVEIWDKAAWDAYYEEASDNFDEVAESLSDLLNHE